MPRKKKRLPPRCQYVDLWENKLTGETGYIQCGSAGTNAYQTCSEPGQHPPAPNVVDETTGWPVLSRGWTVEDIQPPIRRRS